MIDELWLDIPVQISLKNTLGENIALVEGVLTSLGERELVLERPSSHPIITHAQTIIPYSIIGRYYLGASSNK